MKELEEYHRWLEVAAGWLALIDDCYVGELRESLTFFREIKQAELKAPVLPEVLGFFTTCNRVYNVLTVGWS